MSAWPIVSLGEVCEQRTGSRDPKRQPDETFHYVDISSIDNQKKKIVDTKLIRGVDAPSRARRNIKTDDVLVSMTRPNLNSVAMVSPVLDDQICSTGFSVLRSNGNALPDYIFHFVTSRRFIDTISGLVSGAMYPAVTEAQVKGVKLPLPPLPEQRRTVDILNRAGGIRRLRREAQQKGRQIMPSLFVEMFGDPATNPRGHTKITLGEIIVSGPQNGLYRPKSEYGEGTPILRINNFYDGLVNPQSELLRLRLAPETVAKYALSTGDIVINRVNSRPFLGKSALIPNLNEPTVFESNMMRFSLDSEVVVPDYLIAALQHSDIKRQILARAKDAINQSSINQTDVKGLTVLLPSIGSQRAFAEGVADIQAVIAQQDRMSATSEELTKALMARAFDGGL